MVKTREISEKDGIKCQNLAIVLAFIFTLGNIFHMWSSPYCKTVLKKIEKEIRYYDIIHPNKMYSCLQFRKLVKQKHLLAYCGIIFFCGGQCSLVANIFLDRCDDIPLVV